MFTVKSERSLSTTGGSNIDVQRRSAPANESASPDRQPTPPLAEPEPIVVADIGAWSTRFGFCSLGDDEPDFNIRTAVALRTPRAATVEDATIRPTPLRFKLKAKARNEDAGMVEEAKSQPKTLDQGYRWVVGQDAMAMTRQQIGCSPIFPVDEGIVTDWSAMEHIYHHIYYDRLHCAPNEYPLVCSFNPTMNWKQRSVFLEEFLEKMQVPKVLPASDCLLALYSTGGATATVVMSGHSTTHVMPVFQGVPQTSGGTVLSLPVGGDYMTQALAACAKKRGFHLHDYGSDEMAYYEAANRIKESQCYLSDYIKADLLLHRNMAGRVRPNIARDDKEYFEPFRPETLLTDRRFDVLTPHHRYQSSSSTVRSLDVENVARVTDAFELQDPSSPLLWVTELCPLKDATSSSAPITRDRQRYKFRARLGDMGMPLDWKPGGKCPLPDTPEELPPEVMKLMTRRRVFQRSGNLILADGRLGQLGSEQFLVPEMLFSPDLFPTLIGSRVATGIGEIAVQAAKRVDLDVQRELTQNFVIAGGNTLFPGFQDRMVLDLANAWDTSRFRVHPANRGDCSSVWRGGSAVATTDAFQVMFIEKSDFAEFGPGILRAKFLC